MDPRPGRLRAAVVIAALVVGACGTTTAPSPIPTGAQASPEAADPSTAGAAATPEPTLDPSAGTGPGSTPGSPPTPTPTPVATWSVPHRVGTLTTCSTISAGIDVAGRDHVAAECAGSIHYYVSSNGRTWKSTVFAHPANRIDANPQVAFWGDVVYVAYSRIAVLEGACGDNGLRDVGVFFRSRTQPDGTWSSPVRIGSTDDGLRSFRVDGRTIHATVWNARSGHTYYETLTGSTLHRYGIPGAASLRLGSDGHARIAYPGAHGLRYAVFTGSGFSSLPVPGTNERDLDPALVLDGHDKAHVVWTRVPVPPWDGGCASDTPRPKDQGTYYATNASGTWKSGRISKEIGQTSIQVDQETGRVHVIVGAAKVRYYTMAKDGPWQATTLSGSCDQSPLLRLDQSTGALLLVCLRVSRTNATRIYAMTRP